MGNPIVIEGPEQSLVDPTLADAGLPPVVGVQSYCVFRASKAVPEITDHLGYTYHHHVDMACWRGRLYVGWNSCERDEDVWPSRELFSTTTDGVVWSDPQEMFPQGVSTALRMYFYCASNDRMLIIAGLRADRADTDEDRKAGLVVREIHSDHTLGTVYTLQHPLAPSPSFFESSEDSGFLEACKQLLNDRVYLEQQDRGRLLGARRMKWHDASSWGGKVPGDSDKWVAGKAYSFFDRPDGTIVGVSKMGWTTTSTDRRGTWSQPSVPPTLVTGKAKVWSQRTSDGRFALVYNPSTRNRFPLVIVTSDDGITFRDMRIVQGELPRQRYAGMHRSIGPQYVRGISKWSDDGSRASDNVMWLVYSMNKEDIWVSKVPLPVKADETRNVIDGFDDINLYVPKWASAKFTDGELRIENRDPHDYVRATCMFADTSSSSISFEHTGAQIEFDVLSRFGGKSVSQRSLPASDGWKKIEITVEQACQRISFRTGAFRNIGGANPVDPATDRPIDPVRCAIRNLRIKAGT